jgi:P27 family predicted phage terminase small subunit
MPARRSPLKLLDPTERARRVVSDAQAGGLGLDWSHIPVDVDASADARAEWERLGEVYRQMPTRFRESDRTSLVAYTIAFAVFQAASRALLADGLTVKGRSAPDRGRQVKNPSLVVWQQSSSQLRYWCRELGLSPDARARMGLVEENDPDEARRVFGDDLLDPSPFA